MNQTNPHAPTRSGQTGLPHHEVMRIMTGLLSVLAAAMLATTIVSTALPTIMADLNGDQRQYTWVITAALLAMTVSTPIWGKLSDLYQKPRLLLIAIGIFVVGSVGAGFAVNIPMLMGFRGVQGLAMGGLMALTQSVMASIITPRQRGRYAGYMGAVMTVSTVAGPVIGGVITDTIGWRWCFFVSVPVAVIAAVVLHRTLDLPYQPRKVHFDYLGAVLFTIAAALPMLWVTFAGQDYGWLSWQTGAFALGFAIVATLAVRVELRSPEPVVPLRVLGGRTTVLMIVASVGVGVAMFSSGIFMTQYFQLAAGYEPSVAGLMTIPMIIAQMISATTAGQLVSRTGRWKPIMVIGAALLMIGMFGLGTIDHETPFWLLAVHMSVMGLGLGSLVQNTVLAVQNSVAFSDVGAASGAIAFFRSLGGAIGVSVLGAVLAGGVNGRVLAGLGNAGVDPSVLGAGGGDLNIGALPPAVQQIVHFAYGDSFGTLFMICGALATIALIAIIASREVPLRNSIDLPADEHESDAAQR